jgi:hypothetical protein
MTQETDQKALFLSWQDQVTGPHTLREIQMLLKLGKIHSLYKIQSEGEWILLRDHLADLDQKSRDAERKQAERPVVRSSGTFESSVARAAIPVPEEKPAGPMGEPVPLIQSDEEDGNEEGESRGIAITSFVLSLFFFVPFLNGITWLLSLIFGHLSLPDAEHGVRSKYTTMARVGLWLSYVECSFFLLGFAWLAIMEFPNMNMGFYVLHGQMLSTGFGALMGAGILMLAVKLTSGRLIGFSMCFVGALAPSALGALGMFMVQTSVLPSDLTKAKGLVLIGAVHVLLFVAQMFFWARHIRLPEDEELGLSRAAISSLVYTFIFIFLSIGYVVLFATLMK